MSNEKVKRPSSLAMVRDWMKDLTPLLAPAGKGTKQSAVLFALFSFADYKALEGGQECEVTPSLEQLATVVAAGITVIKEIIAQLEDLKIVTSAQRFGTSTRRTIHRHPIQIKAKTDVDEMSNPPSLSVFNETASDGDTNVLGTQQQFRKVYDKLEAPPEGYKWEPSNGIGSCCVCLDESEFISNEKFFCSIKCFKSYELTGHGFLPLRKIGGQ